MPYMIKSGILKGIQLQVCPTGDAIMPYTVKVFPPTIFGNSTPKIGASAGCWVYPVGLVLEVCIEPTSAGFEVSILAPTYECGRCGGDTNKEIVSCGQCAFNEAVSWAESETRRLLTEAVEAAGGKVAWA